MRSTHSILFADKFSNINQCYLKYAPACDDIYDFVGNFNCGEKKEPLTLDNTAWANTVIAAGHLIGVVVFTGMETRVNMNSR